MPAGAPKQPTQWLRITDFSPGCFNYGETTIASSTDRLVPAPPGAADATSTFSCIALPNGGLTALPGVTDSYAWSGASSGATTAYLVGLLVHDELGDGNTEAFAISEYDDGTNHHWQAYSIELETSTTNLIVSTTEPSGAGIFGSPYPQFTRVNYEIVEVSGTPIVATITSGNPVIVSSAGWPGAMVGGTVSVYTVVSGAPAIPEANIIQSIVGNNLTVDTAHTPTGTGTANVAVSSELVAGNPVIAFPAGGPAVPAGQPGQLYLYPNPAAPGVFGALPLIAGGPPYSSVSGQVITYANRILVFAATDYPWPIGGTFFTNENINFTDPPNSATFGNQQTVLVAEDPFGYGAAGTVSTGELFIVKHRGGGLIVTGDIFSPTVTYLPGVQPTGNFYGQTGQGMAGLFYCSYANGAWLWNGSNTAQKISTQLDDNFYLPPEFLGGMQSNNYGYFVQCIGDKAYFSHNWMYDMTKKGWWKYYPDENQGGVSLFWVNPVSGPYIYAAVLSFTGVNTFLYRFDTTTQAQNYQWTSLPLKLTADPPLDPDHVFDIVEVVIRATCTAPHGTITAEILDQGSVVWSQAQAGVVASGPQIIRFNASALGLQQPQARLVVANGVTGDMPVIHELAVRYQPRAPEAANN